MAHLLLELHYLFPNLTLFFVFPAMIWELLIALCKIEEHTIMLELGSY